MRVYHYILSASCACMMSVQAATVIAELPESQSVTQTATMARTSGQELLNKVKDLQNGIYAGGNNNSISNWGVNNEGAWVNEDNAGTITLCGRAGVSGDSFAMVLGGPQQGDSVSSITFSCNTPSSVITSYSMVLAVYDSTGSLVEELSRVQNFSFTSTSETTTVSLDMSDAPLTWEEGYKVVAGVRGGAGTATSAYTITGIQVSYETVPEPATASLGLLGLGAMLLRRRRS
ncbi:PEP-CTERM sorting domain-containing protein [uncultured Akkermansia sp.]|uniref:PEP-CTERM sorting domain-containing protein n=1 Tax=uncultured Akkermansia sp. TaxID=512294 RepID=UPI002805702A|nr:PEP-CTERM sorting domain-containing protein [uncultured Akkermansia sp.]